VPRDLLQRLRAQLKRDPSDGQVAFLVSLAVREPFIVYGSERARLRRLLSAPARSDRDVLLAQSAEHLLARSATPSRGLPRPECGATDTAETEPVPPKKKR
jgi:hypothetical protein